MRCGRRMGVTAVALFTLFIGAGAAAQNGKPPAAKVGDEVITLEELEQSVKSQLAKIEEQRFAILDEKLDQLIGDRLLAQEAKKRGITVDQLIKTEVYAKAPEVSDAEVSDFIAKNRSRLPPGDEAEVKLKVWDYLRGQKVTERRQAYIQTLRAPGRVTVYLE